MPPNCGAGKRMQAGKDEWVKSKQLPSRGDGAIKAAVPSSSCSPILPSPESIPQPYQDNRAAQLLGGQDLPSCDCICTGRQLHTQMQWGCCPQGCRVGSLPAAGHALSIQQQCAAGRPLANSSLVCWQTAILGHLRSSSSPSHLILEELGLILATRQSLNKAKDLGIN